MAHVLIPKVLSTIDLVSRVIRQCLTVIQAFFHRALTFYNPSSRGSRRPLMVPSSLNHQSVKGKETAFGAWISLPGTFAARAISQASPHISWICIDCGHGLIPLHPGVAEIVQAVSGSPTGPTPEGGILEGREAPSVLVRIPAAGSSGSVGWQVKHALDAGASGVIVPLVESVEQAKAIAAECRFPPLGKRGFGHPLTGCSRDLDVVQYAKECNENTFVLVQIETREALKNVEMIAAVDGVDALFIEPLNLSFSLGFPPPSPDPPPDVEKAIQEIKSAAHEAGKAVAIFCSSGEQAAKRAAQGFDIVNVITDSDALMEGIRNNFEIAAVRKTQ